MILVVTATIGEMDPLQELCQSAEVQYLVAGVGLVETTFNLTTYLHHHPEVTRILNVGIAGGYPNRNVSILDCCLASSESIADLGICFDSHTEPLADEFVAFGNQYPCDNPFLTDFSNWLTRHDHAAHLGSFLSVNGVSGTTRRGACMNQNRSICENMEGAAIARVCLGLDLDWLEFRVISNLVEDRDLATWQIKPAIKRYSTIVADFLNGNQQ